jgi:YegS/Rv2252/BmrU family lipid kinase
MRVVMVTNPCSGSRAGTAAADRAARVLGAFWDVSVLQTAGPGAADRLAREAAASGAERVLACGGDGTLSQCVCGLRGTGVPCGLIPSGTGNDFARTAGIPLSPDAAAEYALRGAARPVDLLSVNRGEHLCLNVSGCGLDAFIAEQMNRRRRISGGAAAYLPGIIRGILAYRPQRGRLTVDGVEYLDTWTLVAFANARCYGAGIRIAPAAEFDDGMMDVIAVAGLSKLDTLRCLPLLLRGRHLGHPSVRTWRARRAVFETEAPAPVAIDGDVVCRTPVSFDVLPAAALLWLEGESGTGVLH